MRKRHLKMIYLSFLAMMSDVRGLHSMISGENCIISTNIRAFPMRFALYTATARAAEMAGIGDITGTLEKINVQI